MKMLIKYLFGLTVASASPSLRVAPATKISGEYYAPFTASANDYDVWRALRLGKQLRCIGNGSDTEAEDHKCYLINQQSHNGVAGYGTIYAANVDSDQCLHWMEHFDCDVDQSSLYCGLAGDATQYGHVGKSVGCYLADCLNVLKWSPFWNRPTPYPYPRSPTNTVWNPARVSTNRGHHIEWDDDDLVKYWKPLKVLGGGCEWYTEAPLPTHEPRTYIPWETMTMETGLTWEVTPSKKIWNPDQTWPTPDPTTETPRTQIVITDDEPNTVQLLAEE